MATRKKEPVVLREGSDGLWSSSVTEMPAGEFVSEVHACKIVSFRQHDGLLETDGVIVGDTLGQGRYSGAKVTGIYVTQHGCVVELDHAGQARTILHTGDYAAELADA